MWARVLERDGVSERNEMLLKEEEKLRENMNKKDDNAVSFLVFGDCFFH